jgi:hypothetical protein
MSTIFGRSVYRSYFIFWIGLGFWSLNGSAEAIDSDGLVAGVIGRSEGVFSGIFNYHYESGFGSIGKVVNSDDRMFAFAGDDWIYELPSITRLNHTDSLIELNKVPQQDGSIRSSMYIYRPQEFQSLNPPPPTFIGSLWYRTSLSFIKHHIKDVRLGSQTVIAGVTTYQLDWNVSQTEVGAFGTMPPHLTKGGVLRLYVAPTLGYALPLIEYVDRDGTVCQKYTSTEFKEFANGVFIPFNSKEESFSDKGDSGFYQKFEIKSITHLNEVIDQNLFSVVIPSDTVIAETRQEGGAKIYRTSKEGISADLSQLLQAMPPTTNWSFLRISLIAGNVLLILLLIVASRYRSRKHESLS